MPWNPGAITSALASEIGKTLPDTGSHGQFFVNPSEIYLRDEVSSSGARHIHTVKVEDFVNAFNDKAVLEAVAPPVEFTVAELKRVDPNDDMGYHYVIDQWETDGLVPSS